jgi:hypothetical protein
MGSGLGTYSSLDRPLRHRAPGGVSGQDQGRNTRQGHGRLIGCGRIRPDALGIGNPPDPVRHRLGEALDIARQRCIMLEMIGGVIADHVDHRRMGASCIVEIGEPVGETGSQMQESGGRLVSHSGVAIGGAGDHALEKAEHAAHPRLAVECRHEVHLGGTGIGEADVHVVREQHVTQAIGTVHVVLACRISATEPREIVSRSCREAVRMSLSGFPCSVLPRPERPCVRLEHASM